MDRRNAMIALAAVAGTGLQGCGGGGGSGDDLVLAQIKSFTADQSSVNLGGTVRLSASFQVTGTVGIVGVDSSVYAQPISSGGTITTPAIFRTTEFVLGVRGTGGAATNISADNFTSAYVIVAVRYSGVLGTIAGGPQKADHVQVTLSDGSIALFGGRDAAGALSSEVVLYKPSTGTFSSGGFLRTGRTGHTATLLLDGTVLIVGGARNSTTSPIAERWDPVTQTSRLPSRQPDTDRTAHAAQRLSDGRVLITGGEQGTSLLNTIDAYDPTSDQFMTQTSRLAVARSHHAMAATTPGGSVVLIAGGETLDGSPAPVELFNLSLGALTTVPLPASETALRIGPTIVPIVSTDFAHFGQVLIIGGHAGNGAALSSVLRFTSPNTLTASSPLLAARRDAAAVFLGDERVWVTGGSTTADPVGLASTEFIALDGTVTNGPTLTSGRTRHAVTLAGNGRALVTGGFDASQSVVSSADVLS